MKKWFYLFAWLVLVPGLYSQRNITVSQDTVLMLPVVSSDSLPDSLQWIPFAFDESLKNGLSAIQGFYLAPKPELYRSSSPVADEFLKLAKTANARYVIGCYVGSGKNMVNIKWAFVDVKKPKELMVTLQLQPANDPEGIITYAKIILNDFLKLPKKLTKRNSEQINDRIMISKNTVAIQKYYSALSIEKGTGLSDSVESLLSQAVRLDSAFKNGYAQLARVQTLRKKYDPVIQTYQRLIKIDSMNYEWYSTVGDIYYYHKDMVPQAKRFYQQAVRFNPADVKSVIQIGYCDYVSKEYELAGYQGKQAITQDSLNSDAYNLLGICAVSLDDTLRARNYFLKAISVNRNEITARKNLARLYQEQRRDDDAVRLLQEVVALDPDDGSARLTLSAIHYKLNNLYKAVMEYTTAVILKPEYENTKTNPVQILSLITKNKTNMKTIQWVADSLQTLALDAESGTLQEFWCRAVLGYLQLYYLNKPGEAVNHFQNILITRSGIPRLYFLIGEAYYALDKLTQASQAYTRYANDAADNFSYAKTLLMIGKILIKQRRYEDAELTILKSTRMYPNAESYYLYAVALGGSQKFDDAVIQYQKAISVYPNYTDAYIGLGNAFHQLNKTDQAIKSFLKAAELDSGNATLRQSLAAFYLAQGQLREAEQEVMTGFRLSRLTKTELPTLYGIYGDILYQQKKYKESLKQFQTQIRLDTVSLDPYLRIAVVYAVQKKHDDAVEWIEKLFVKGFRLFSKIETEPAFATLREKKPYKELMALYKKKYDDEVMKKLLQQGK